MTCCTELGNVWTELLEFSKPLKDDPANEERFYQFLGDRTARSPARSTGSGGTNWLCIRECSRPVPVTSERLDLKAAEKVKRTWPR